MPRAGTSATFAGNGAGTGAVPARNLSAGIRKSEYASTAALFTSGVVSAGAATAAAFQFEFAGAMAAFACTVIFSGAAANTTGNDQIPIAAATRTSIMVSARTIAGTAFKSNFSETTATVANVVAYRKRTFFAIAAVRFPITAAAESGTKLPVTVTLVIAHCTSFLLLVL